MSIAIDDFTRTVTKWQYDNAWKYNDQGWDSYAGPVYGRGNYLVMLNHKRGTIVLHYERGAATEREVPREIWSGQIADRSDFDRMIDFLDQYDQQYRAENNLDPMHDYEQDLIREDQELIRQRRLQSK